MKKYIVRTPESDRTVINVPETLADLAPYSTTLVTFTTGTNLTANYPITVTTQFGSILGAQIIRAVNVTNPGEVNYEPIQLANWSASGGILSINHISGLAPSTQYTLYLVIYAG